MATPIKTRQSDFTEMDNAGVSKEHWKIMFISGMGFFTDAYDLFIIGVVMAMLKPMWHVGKVEEGLVESTALLAAAIGALLFGRIATKPLVDGFWHQHTDFGSAQHHNGGRENKRNPTFIPPLLS